MAEQCPYCEVELEINHDDGVGYDEDVIHSQECWSCEKTFAYTTSIVLYYDLRPAPCLNGEGEHQYKATIIVPRKYTKMRCQVCEETREPTTDEWEEILK